MIWNVNVAASGRFIDLFYFSLKKKKGNENYLSVEEDSKKRRPSAFI